MNTDCRKVACAIFAVSLCAQSTYAASQRNEGISVTDSVKGLLEMENLDKRKPVLLTPEMALHQKQNMREHLEVIQSIVSAMIKDDFPAVAQAAKKIGYSKQMEQMCTHMGAEAPGFTELALLFHRTADTIGEAARFKDRASTLSALDKTLQTCTSCHAQFRQKIVDRSHKMRESGKK